jgi:2-polyprenyl-3-methyl-5-hydroxy-6-metoxy-1,4-benzoquinol methylase
MSTNREIKKFYNKVFKKGEKKHFTSFLTTGKPALETEEVLKEIKWKDKKIIDVGCGTGLFAFCAAQKGATVLGIDYSKVAIDIAKEKYKAPNLQFKQLDAARLCGKYDVIVSIGTLEHMDNPFKILKLFKKHLTINGRIIITSPNWTNPRGYILMTLWHLFKAPITLADLHYLTPINFMKWAKKLNLNLKWRTFDRSWAHGDVLIKDLTRRLPNVLADTKLPRKIKNINNFIKWLKENVVPFNNSLAHSGATGIYIFSCPKKQK